MQREARSVCKVASRPRGCVSSFKRRAAVALEFALVAPVVILLACGVIEFGRCLMVTEGLEEAARQGCRAAIMWNATAATVERAVNDYLQAYHVSSHTVTITPTNPSTAAQWTSVTVRVSVPYSDVSWIPVPQFLGSVTLSGTCTMPQEAKNESVAVSPSNPGSPPFGKMLLLAVPVSMPAPSPESLLPVEEVIE